MAKKTARKANAAFMRPVTPSATLAEVVSSLGRVLPDRACGIDDPRIRHRFAKLPVERPGTV